MRIWLFLFGVLAGNFVASSDIVVHPKGSVAHLRNPGMGFIYYGLNDIPDEADILFVWIDSWDEVNPEPCVFRWDIPKITKTIEKARETGRQAGMRVLPNFHPQSHPLPAFLREKGVRLLPRDDGANFEPEWWHPAYRAACEDFVRAYGKQFDGADWLAFVDMRFYGFWGEGHRYGATEPWPSTVDKREWIRGLLDLYLQSFRKTPLAVEAATDKDTPFPHGTAVDYAVEHGCWMRRDGFGPFISGGETAFIDQEWKHSLLIAENGLSYADFLAGKVKRGWEKDAKTMTLDDVFQQMLDHHVNYFPLGWGRGDYDAVKKARPDLLARADEKMGYRFVIPEARWPERVKRGREFEVRVSWRNLGVGRLPFLYRPRVILREEAGKIWAEAADENADPRKWYAGADYVSQVKLAVPRECRSKKLSVFVAMKDGEKSLRLSLETPNDRGMYRLGELAVSR